MGLSLRYAKLSSSDIRYYFYQLQEVQDMMSVVNPKKAERYDQAVQRYYAVMTYIVER